MSRSSRVDSYVPVRFPFCPDFAEMAQRHLSKARYFHRRGMAAEAASYFRIAEAMAAEAKRVRGLAR